MPPQVIQIPLGAGGIDQKTAQEYVDPNSRALVVVNGVYTYDGSVAKRLGTQGLSNTAGTGNNQFGNPLKVASRGNEILALDGNDLFSYIAPANAWRPTSPTSPGLITRKHLQTSPVATGADGFSSYSIAEGAGYRAIASRDTLFPLNLQQAGNIFFDLYDLTTGATVFLKKAITTTGSGTGYSTPTVIILGTICYLFYADNNGTIWGQTMSLVGSAFTWTSPTAIISDGSLSSPASTVEYHASQYSTGNNGILIFYAQATAGPTFTPRYLRLEALPALTISASGTVDTAEPGPITCVCARYDSSASTGQVWFGWEQSTGGDGPHLSRWGRAYNTSWAPLAAKFSIAFPNANNTTTVCSMAVDLDVSQAVSPLGVYICGDVSGFSATGYVGQSTLAAYKFDGSLEYAQVFVFANAVSVPFRMNCGVTSYTFVMLGLSQEYGRGLKPQQCSYVLWNCSTGRIAGVSAIIQGSAFGPEEMATRDGRFPIVTNVGALVGTTSMLGLTNMTAELNASNIGGVLTSAEGATEAVDLISVDFTGATAWQYAEGTGETFFSGALAGVYDTKAFQEMSWITWPSGATLTNATTGGTIPDGSYEYAFLYSYVDNAGLVHRSLPWTANVTTAGGGTSKTTWIFETTPYTLHASSTSQVCYLEMYRTDGVSSQLYFVQSFNFTAGTTTAIDDNSNFSSSYPLIYTTGGVLQAISAPSARAITRHVERIWIVDDLGLNVWYSTPFNGADAPYFNPGFTLSFTDAVLTAIADLDDKLVLWSASSIWYVEGQGPSLNGQGSDLNVAVEVQTDVGAIDWRSVVAFPVGILFQAPNFGIYLLDRGLNVSFLGKDVQNMTQGHYVISSTLVPNDTTVRFILDNGMVLAYNYVYGRWSEHVYPTGEGLCGVPVCSALAGGVWTAGAAEGFVMQEKIPSSTNANVDTGPGGFNSWVSTQIQTPWIKPGGIQGWAQVDLVQGIARFVDECDIDVTLSYDYGVTTESRALTYASLSASNSTMAQWRIGPAAANMQPESISVTVSDQPPTGGSYTSGAGARWLGVAVSVTSLGTIYDKLGVGVKR